MTENDHNWGPFTWGPWTNTIRIEWNSGGEEEGYPHNFLRIVAFGWAVRMRLPNILRPWKEKHVALGWSKEDVERIGRDWYYNVWPREYGFALSNMGNGYDFLQIHFGAQTHSSDTTQDWCCHLPWKQWDCVRHSMYHPDGTHYFTEPRDNRGRGNWDAWWKAKQECPLVHFEIRDHDGQKRIASCHIEEREWHRGTGWFKWLKWFSKPKIRRDLDISFDYEVGPEKGSWKGGTVGTGIEMLPYEYPLNAFKRFCQKDHNALHGRTYKLQYVGPCDAPSKDCVTDKSVN